MPIFPISAPTSAPFRALFRALFRAPYVTGTSSGMSSVWCNARRHRALTALSVLWIAHTTAPRLLWGQMPAMPVVSATFAAPTLSVDLRRYATIQECDEAARRTDDSVSARGVVDTLPEPDVPPPSPAVIQVARQCLARFPMTTVDARDWQRLLDVTVLANDEPAIQAVVAHHIATSPTLREPMRVANPAEEIPLQAGVRARAKILFDVYNRLTLPGRPPHGQLAETFARQVDALGPEALIEQLNIRDQKFWIAIQHLALDSILEEGKTLLTFAAQPVPAALRNDPDIGMISDIARLVPSMLGWYTFLKTGSEEAFTRYLASYMPMTQGAQLVGKQALPITGDFWFNNTLSSGPTPVPPPGRVSLLVFLYQRCTDISCWKTYAALHRFHQHLPAVPITIVTRTEGVFRMQRMASTEAEAAMLHHYVTDFLHLPGILSVSTAASLTLPAPDGRVFPLPSANEERYGLGLATELNNLTVFVVDARGKIVYVVNGMGNQEKELTAAVQVLQQLQSKLSPATSPASLPGAHGTPHTPVPRN